MTESSTPAAVAESAEDETYTMTVDLSVLESLGINLYSNAAAVLSELVANAYDADAGQVDITWQPRAAPSPLGQTGQPVAEGPTTAADPPDEEPAVQEVVISDDGCGMTVPEANARFLKAGYKKRDAEGNRSPKGRPFMGRKGIGKLSVFSLAQTVEVYSKTEGGQPHGFQIRVEALEDAIRLSRPYHPVPVAVPAEYAKRGTTLVLSDLKKKRAGLTANALRKRLARRFDVLDPRTPEAGGFHIFINGTRITWADRQELKRLEFIWEFPATNLEPHVLPPGVRRFALASGAVNAQRGWTISGWFGTAKRPTDLVDDEEAGSLKNIIVLARKRPIQEGIIEKLDFSRLFGNYVTGQIEADFLDSDDPEYDDIATSDRQRLIEDDERVLALQDFLRKAFVTAADDWSEARPKKEAADALVNYPKLQEWLSKRPDWQKPAAEGMIGTIASLELERRNEKEDRASLFRSGVLAFERIGLREVARDLENLSMVTAEDLLHLLGAQDAYESALWLDILRSRVEAISSFRNLTRADEKEKVLQEHLFDHLWLLDPAWERAATSTRMEENLRHIAPDAFPVDEAGKELTGRIDIRYAQANGRHVIVELKRYTVKKDALELQEQGLKYYSALRSILEQQNRADEPIEVVFVLGEKPGAARRGGESVDEYSESMFKSISGRYVLYDELIENACRQYEDYLEASDRARELDELLAALGPEDSD